MWLIKFREDTDVTDVETDMTTVSYDVLALLNFAAKAQDYLNLELAKKGIGVGLQQALIESHRKMGQLSNAINNAMYLAKDIQESMITKMEG